MSPRSPPKSELSPSFRGTALSLYGKHFSKVAGEASEDVEDFSIFFQSGEHPALMVNCLLQGEAYSGAHEGAPVSSEVTGPHQVVLWRQRPIKQTPHPIIP